jgi:periplasmic protein TonB
MFSDLVESVASKQRTNRRWTVIVSAALQSACLLVVILVPLVYTHALPIGVFSRTPVVPYLVPPPVQVTQVHVVSAPTQSGGDLRFHAPSLSMSGPASPGRHRIDFGDSLSTPPEQVGDNGPYISGPAVGPPVLGPAGPSGPPAPPAPDNSHRRISQGGQVEAARIISRPDPIYPEWARRAGIQGDVVLHAIIGTDGRILELHAVSGNPLLVRPALDAVQQWRYQPTLLNGEPVEVETTITVSFIIGR